MPDLTAEERCRVAREILENADRRHVNGCPYVPLDLVEHALSHLREPPTRHVFGGVEFEETGVRTSDPQEGTWVYGGRGHGPVYCGPRVVGYDYLMKVLRPVRVMGGPDE